MKRLTLIASFVILGLMFPTVVTSANTPSNSIIGMSLTEGDSLQTALSNLNAGISSGNGNSSVWCDGIDDPDCLGNSLGVRAFLLPCSESATMACIKDVFAKSEDGTKVSATFIRSVAQSQKFDFEEDVSRGVIAGTGTGGLWSFSGLSHGGGSNVYAVQARVDGWTQRNQTFNYGRIEFGIAAVRENLGNYLLNALVFKDGTTIDEIRGADTIGSNGRPDFKCVMTEVGKCFERVEFPENYRFGMTVLLPNKLSGWFHGRISSPEINIANFGSGYEYTIEANPVEVPFIREQVTPASWSPELVDYVNKNFTCNPDCSNTGGGFMMPGNSGKFAFDLTRLFLPVIKDKSTGTGDYWSVRTLDMWEEGQNSSLLQSCSSNSEAVSGIVTTNSMVYNAGPPSYNEATGSLDYKVLSPHFNEKNEENIGSYDLLLDSKVARCVYKFSNAPIKAEIEILGSDGVNKVATTVIGEKNGWLFMSANGFTYSEPIVRIKLSQESPAPEPSPTPTPTSTPTSTVSSNSQGSSAVLVSKKRVSITCVKGIKTKKITAVKPKCPKGFKKA